jgi:hypothetical protein
LIVARGGTWTYRYEWMLRHPLDGGGCGVVAAVDSKNGKESRFSKSRFEGFNPWAGRRIYTL